MIGDDKPDGNGWTAKYVIEVHLEYLLYETTERRLKVDVSEAHHFAMIRCAASCTFAFDITDENAFLLFAFSK